MIVNKLKDAPEKKNSNKIEKVVGRLYPEISFLEDAPKDYFIHYNSSHQCSKPGANKTTFSLKLEGERKFIKNKVSTIELCENYAIAVIVDERNNIFILDLNRFDIVREIKISKILGNAGKIFQVSICHLTGDFVCVTPKHVILLSVNGVVLGALDLHKFRSFSDITTGMIKSVKSRLN